MAISFTEGKIKIHVTNEGEVDIRSFFETIMSSVRDHVVVIAELPWMRDHKHLFNTALAIYDLAVALNEVNHSDDNLFEHDFEGEFSIRGGVEHFPLDELKTVLGDKNVERVDFEMFTLYGVPDLKVEWWTVQDMKVFRGTPAMFDLEEL